MLSGCGIKNEKIRFGSAGIGGMYYTFGNAFTELASKENDKFNFEVKSTAGSAANIRLLSKNYIEMGIAQADLINDAYNGTGIFVSTQCSGYKAIAALYPEACQIVVHNDSGINSIDDLLGKKVSIGESDSGTEQTANLILQLNGLSDKLVDTLNYDYTTAAGKLQSGEIDAFFCTAGTRTEVIGQLSKECDICLISLDDKCIDKMLSAYSLCEKYTIPAGTYNGQDSDVTTIGVKAVLIAKQSLSDDVIKNVTKTIYEHADDFKYATSLDISFDINTAADGVDIPFHSGAAAYYTERGINVLTE